jgi:hypothetical protein
MHVGTTAVGDNLPTAEAAERSALIPQEFRGQVDPGEVERREMAATLREIRQEAAAARAGVVGATNNEDEIIAIEAHYNEMAEKIQQRQLKYSPYLLGSLAYDRGKKNLSLPYLHHPQ